jgi:hypothetical protein
MGEHDAGPVVICEDQQALERTWCQHDPIGTDMPDPDACVPDQRGIPKMIASPLNDDDIILVVQANCSASAQISEVSMRENIPQCRW